MEVSPGRESWVQVSGCIGYSAFGAGVGCGFGGVAGIDTYTVQDTFMNS